MANVKNISGLRELEQALQELPKRVAKKRLGQAVSAGAQIVKQDAKARAPVDTGKLRRNMIKRKKKRTPQTLVTYQVKPRNTGKKTRNDPKSVPYWWLVEFGTKKAPAQPFLRPAFEANKEQAADTIKDRLKLGIEQEAERLGRK